MIEDWKPRFHEGHKFTGPDGMGYILTRNVTTDDYILASDFKPFGNAPQPLTGEIIPGWLAVQLWPEGL